MSQWWNVTDISHCVSKSKAKPLLEVTIGSHTQNDYIQYCIYALAFCRMCVCVKRFLKNSCWRRQMETFSALLAICTGNSPVPVEFPAERPVTRSFDAFFDLRLNKRMSKQSCGWRFDISRPLWRHRNVCLLRSMSEEWYIWSSMIHWCLFPLIVRKWEGVYFVSTTQIKNWSSVIKMTSLWCNIMKTHVRGFFDTDLHEVSWHFATHEAVRPSGF